MKKRTLVSLLILISFGLANLSPLISKAESLCLVSEPTIEISEFSFNNSTKDYIDITIVDDGNNGKGAALDGYTITSIDKTLKRVSGIIAKTGDRLHFDDIGNLTATTDQLLLQKGERTLDAVCWVNDKPTAREMADFKKLEESGSWSPDIFSCMRSMVAKNTAFKRKTEKDTNTADDWEAIKQTPQQVPVEVAPAIAPSPQTTIQTPAISVATDEIIINEFMPDPEGSDDGNEWIELKNTGDHEVSMAGWQLDDEEEGSKPYQLKNFTIRAESFLVLKNSETGITLNNTADSVRLLAPDGKEYLKVAYAKTSTGSSWALAPDKTWRITKKPTPGEENMFEETQKQENTSASGTENNAATPIPSPNPLVEISELLPNPKGPDQGKEWIELHNLTSAPVILEGWKVKNGSTKTFTMPQGSIIPGNGYLIITDQLSKLSLKNSNDEVQIIDSENQIQDNVSFEDAPENFSLAKITSVDFDEAVQISRQGKFVQYFIPKAHARAESESLWQWTDMITKGKPNPKLIHAKGKITREPDESNTFSVRTVKGEIRIAHVDSELAKTLLKKDKEIDIKAFEGENQTYRLESFSTENDTEKQPNISENNTMTTKTIAGAILLILLAASLYLKYITKKSITPVDDQAASEQDGTPARTFPKVQW